MDTIHLLLLSIIQGLTEFIPISSSAHLILLSEIIDQEDQGIFFDVCVHFGTTIAAVIYFKKEIKEMILKISIKSLSYSDNSLFFNLLVALIPVLIFGASAVDAVLGGFSAKPQLLILSGLLVAALPLCPWAGAAALRQSME